MDRAEMTPELSIAIVLHNSAHALAECLTSIRDAVEDTWAEVIAVDNASPDRSVEIMRRELAVAQVLTSSHNRGFAAGVNAATARAVGRYWLLLNPDVRVPAGGLKALITWMDGHPRIGAASPEIVSIAGAWESPGRASPSVARTLLELSRLHRLLPLELRGRILRGPYWPHGDQLDTGWVPGTAMIVRPQTVRGVGPMREDLFMYGEDLEWCWRMRRAGWRIGVCSSTTFEHHTSSSARQSFCEGEKERRIAAGIDAACRSMYGQTHARALAAVTAVSLGLESCAPGRDPAHRQRSRRAARNWQNLARRR